MYEIPANQRVRPERPAVPSMHTIEAITVMAAVLAKP